MMMERFFARTSRDQESVQRRILEDRHKREVNQASRQMGLLQKQGVFRINHDTSMDPVRMSFATTMSNAIPASLDEVCYFAVREDRMPIGTTITRTAGITHV